MAGKLLTVVIAMHAAVAAGLAGGSALAQQQTDQEPAARSALLEEVVVTARKREESMQDVPLAVTALGQSQLEALKVRNLTDVQFGMPSVVLTENGTQKGTANFSIRGLSALSSIGGVDPAVGVFVDGVYMGLNNGVILDMYDVRSLEVLRGPQGTLFGRNTTGGAVLVNNNAPSDTPEVSARAAVDGNPNGDGGLNYYLMGMVSGPLSETFSARLVAYYNNDDGWFTNNFDGKNFGENETIMVRPSIRWTPNDDVELIVRYEYQNVKADGANGQSHTNGSGIPGTPVNYKRGTFNFSIDEPGHDNRRVDFLTTTLNWDVGFGNGMVTNILGWRDVSAKALLDVDSQPVWMFHASIGIDYEQVSDELRYVGTFGDASVTTGVLYYTNDLKYDEGRYLLGIATGGVRPALTQDGGGHHEVESLSWFGAVDYALNENWVLNVGLNVTNEKKDVKIASLFRNVDDQCDVLQGTCPYDFEDDTSWTNVSPKLGVTYTFASGSIGYGSWSRGYRSGLYNLRNTVPDPAGPGPVDEEQADSFEVGFKTDFGGRGRLNGAVYYATLKDAQRVVETPGAVSGVVQVLKNAADVEYLGFELETSWALTDRLTFIGNVGYLDASYTKVSYDLNADGAVDGKDKDLTPPTAPDWTYLLGLTHTLPIGSWEMASRINYAYTAKMYVSEDNKSYFDSVGMLGAGIDFRQADGHWAVGIYGKNLLNDVSYTNDTQLPTLLGPLPLGGTFASMQKGRVLGLEASYSF